MMLASSAIAASPPSGDYIRSFDGMSALARASLTGSDASLNAELVTGFAKPRHLELESRLSLVIVTPDNRQETVI